MSYSWKTISWALLIVCFLYCDCAAILSQKVPRRASSSSSKGKKSSGSTPKKPATSKSTGKNPTTEKSPNTNKKSSTVNEKPKYTVETGEWGECSSLCVRQRTVGCYDEKHAVVAPSLCGGDLPPETDSCLEAGCSEKEIEQEQQTEQATSKSTGKNPTPEKSPNEKSSTVNEEPKYTVETGEWGECSSLCVRQRTVGCYDEKHAVVAPSLCGDDLPPETDSCLEAGCSEKESEQEQQTEQATSKSTGKKLTTEKSPNEKSITVNEKPKYTVETGEWGECSSLCVRQRTVGCYDENHATVAPSLCGGDLPPETDSCLEAECSEKESKQEQQTGQECWWAACGGGTASAKCADVSPYSYCSSDPESRHAVRCCSDASVAGFQETTCLESALWVTTKGGGLECNAASTFGEAEALCASAGARLCSVAELAAGCLAAAGCSFDTEYIWAADSASFLDLGEGECQMLDRTTLKYEIKTFEGTTCEMNCLNSDQCTGYSILENKHCIMFTSGPLDKNALREVPPQYEGVHCIAKITPADTDPSSTSQGSGLSEDIKKEMVARSSAEHSAHSGSSSEANPNFHPSFGDTSPSNAPPPVPVISQDAVPSSNSKPSNPQGNNAVTTTLTHSSSNTKSSKQGKTDSKKQGTSSSRAEKVVSEKELVGTLLPAVPPESRPKSSSMNGPSEKFRLKHYITSTEILQGSNEEIRKQEQEKFNTLLYSATGVGAVLLFGFVICRRCKRGNASKSSRKQKLLPTFEKYENPFAAIMEDSHGGVEMSYRQKY